MSFINNQPRGESEEQLREIIEILSQRVAELESTSHKLDSSPRPLDFSDEKLARMALLIYRSRERRKGYFNPDLFGEPAWDMLLDLFISKVRGVRLSTTSLCLAAGVPQATGLRWLGLVVNAGLARRSNAPDDARLKPVEMTPEGYRQMRRYISESVVRFEMPTLD